MDEESGGLQPFRLIVGLGNPGRRYQRTRHNVGFLVVDRLVEREGASWSQDKKWEAEVAKGAERYYLKPRTFMNLSGRSVAGIANFYKIEPGKILIIYDDVDLALGVMRFRTTGSAGGHRGVASVIELLGTRDFGRLKIGVGRSSRGGMDLADHVLSPFLAEEEPILEKSLDRAVEAVNDASSRGLEAAMTDYNRKPAPEKRRESDAKANEDPEAEIEDDRL